MTTRTFKQQGAVFGTSAATITAAIDGVTVFSGQVSPSGNTFPVDQSALTFSDIYTWIGNVDFSGTNALTITVSGADLLLSDTFANYIPGNAPPPSADTYGDFYNITVDGNVISDPLSAVTIDGVEQTVDRSINNLFGQWYWQIQDGSTLTATINVQAGQVPA